MARAASLESSDTQAANALRRGILNGDLAWAGRIFEIGAGHDIGISRGTLRGALPQLPREGLADQKTCRGTNVAALVPRHALARRGMLAFSLPVPDHGCDRFIDAVDRFAFQHKQLLLPEGVEATA